MVFARDRDLLVLEPGVFREVSWAGQLRVSASDGVVSGTSLVSATSDFEAAGVDAGHVVVVAGLALEILARVSATELTVSMLRDDAAGVAIAPRVGAGVKALSVHSFGPQIALVHGQAMRGLGLEVGDEGQVVDGEALTLLEALGALHLVYSGAMALAGGSASGLALKAEMYRERVALERSRVAVGVDVDGDGEAVEVRRLNTGRFVRAS